jgi:NTE family protein
MPYWNGIEQEPKTALALSGGGMFGAYQAGAWMALARRFRPDIVVGVSAGALNAWAIAGGAPPEDLAAGWLAPGCRAFCRGRLRQPPWRGVFDSEALHAHVRAWHARYAPRIRVGVVATEIPRLHARLFEDREIDWRVLAASAALPLVYRPVKVGGHWYVDGGVLSPVPVWAAARMGATRILAISVVDPPPSAVAAALARAFRALRPAPAAGLAGVDLRILHPARRLGSLRDAAFWRRDAVERWLRLGEEDAAGFGLWADP